MSFLNNFFNRNDKESKNVCYEMQEKNKDGIIESSLKDRKVSIASKNEIKMEEEAIIKEYANINSHQEAFYYIAGKSSKKTGFIVVYQYENSKETIFTIEEKELPEDYYINCILRMKKNKYYIDKNSSNEIEEQLKQMIARVLENQDKELQEYRKENHLYRVEEDMESKIFLWDMTDKPEFSIEEVDFPNELIQNAKEGAVFEFKNGTYRIYTEKNL